MNAIVHSLSSILRFVVYLTVVGGAVDIGLAAAPDSVRITYIGNEGFLIEVGGKKVLIDALYRSGVPGYVSHPPERRRQLEKAQAPFHDVDVILATHYHADHFDPMAVGSHLVNNRQAQFVSTRQAVFVLEDEFPAWRHILPRVTASLPAEGTFDTLDLGGIQVTCLNLHHGRNRPVENLGFVIEIDGWRFLHIGDTEATPDELASLGLRELGIDVFFVPYWFLAYSDWDGRIEPAVGSPILVPMHIPPPDDPRHYLKDLGGFDGTIRHILSKYPTALIFESGMQEETL